MTKKARKPKPIPPGTYTAKVDKVKIVGNQVLIKMKDFKPLKKRRV